MLRQWSVARLATNADMLPSILFLNDIAVAVLTRLPTGVGDRPSCDLCDRRASVVAVFPESLRNKDATHTDKQDQPKQEDDRQAEEMS